MAFQGKLPILLSVLFVSAILGLAGWRLHTWRGVELGLGIALVLLYIVWLFLEARVALGEVDQKETTQDKGTLQVYAAGRALTVLSALGFPTVVLHADATLPMLAGGLCLFVCGAGFRLHAIRVLGRFYSHYVREQEDHRIVDTGPYRVLRHPAYTGMLLAHFGVVIALFNWVALGFLLLLFVPAVVRRILVEETMLMQIPGYPEFAEGRKRLVPLVW